MKSKILGLLTIVIILTFALLIIKDLDNKIIKSIDNQLLETIKPYINNVTYVSESGEYNLKIKKVSLPDEMSYLHSLDSIADVFFDICSNDSVLGQGFVKINVKRISPNNDFHVVRGTALFSYRADLFKEFTAIYIRHKNHENYEIYDSNFIFQENTDPFKYSYEDNILYIQVEFLNTVKDENLIIPVTVTYK